MKVVGEIVSLAIMLAAAALFIKWGSWFLANIDDALDAKSPPAETFERGGTGAAGGRGAFNAQQLGDACNNSRPLDGGF